MIRSPTDDASAFSTSLTTSICRRRVARELTGIVNPRARDPEKPRGVAEIEPPLDPVISRFERRNAVMRAQRCDALPLQR